MGRTEWLVLRPRDTVLVRDGRQFNAGVDVTAEPVLPRPSTVAGAAYAAYGTDGPEPEAIRGPVLARLVGEAWEAAFPAPADLVHPPGDIRAVQRLQPCPLPVTTDLPDCGQWLVGDGDPMPGWVSARALSRYLRGELVQPGGEVGVQECEVEFGPGTHPAEPLVAERRVGLARTEDRVARVGLLYQATHLRPAEQVGFLVECALGDGWDRSARGAVPIGGRGRLADVEPVSGVAWPAPPEAFPGGRVLVYVATPAIWPGGWRFPVPVDRGARLVAAAVGATETIATASPRLGMSQSRVLRWAVPAGSVYLLEFTGAGGEDAAAQWAGEVHQTAYGRAERDRLCTAGFGVILTGVWQ